MRDKTVARTTPLNRCRNFGIMAHIDAGKTTTTERILFYTGITHRIGEGTKCTKNCDHGLDGAGAGARHYYHVRGDDMHLEEHPHQHYRYAGPRRTFTAEVERSLRVLDGAVACFDAVAGVQPQSETVWRQADKYKVPRICFINKMDKARRGCGLCHFDDCRSSWCARRSRSTSRLARRQSSLA